MSVQPDPEDLNINSAKLAQQNERVLSAQEKAKQEADEDEALENFANAFKGKPIPDDWEPNSHPYFMSDLEREMQAGNPYVDAFQQLLYEDPPEEIAENKKQQGNDALKRGPKYYDDAIKCYTAAIDAGSSDNKANAVYYSNRAAVQLLKRNFGKVIEDCESALKLDAGNVKAYFRCSKAMLGLHKYTQAMEKMEAGLKVDGENKELKKMLEETRKKHQQQQDEVKKKEQAKAKAMVAESSKSRAARKAIEDRGIVMGESVYQGLSGGQNVESKVDEEGHLHWPVLVVYPEFDQSDFLQDVHELAAVADTIALLFDPSQPPPDWDQGRKYTTSSVRVYYASYACKELSTGKKKVESDEDFIGSLLSGSDRKGKAEEYARADKSKYIEVDLTKSLVEVLQQEGHVVPGFPVFHVVVRDSVFERHFLAKGPTEF